MPPSSSNQKCEPAWAFGEAVKAFEHGGWTHADRVCRQLLSDGHHRPEVWTLCAMVGLSVQRFDVAHTCVERALGLRKGFARAMELAPRVRAGLAQMPRLPDASPTTPAGLPRLLLIEPLGTGFWSEVDHVIAQVLLARAANRVPVVAWGPRHVYHDGAPDTNAWDSFFEPLPSGASLADARETIARAQALGQPARFPPREGLAPVNGALSSFQQPAAVVAAGVHTPLLHVLDWLQPGQEFFAPGLAAQSPQRELAAARALAQRLLRPVARVREETDRCEQQLRAGLPAGAPILATHVRAGDKYLELNEVGQPADRTSEYLQRVDAFLASHQSARVLLVTDGSHVEALFRARYGDRVYVPSAERTDQPVGLHLRKDNSPAVRRRLGEEVLRDVLLCARCDRFLGLGWSNVTRFVRFLKDWPKGTWDCFGPIGQTQYIDAAR